jgi:hypothetical protein
MTISLRAAFELGFGLTMVVASIVVGLRITESSELTNLLLGGISLVGILAMAHGIWLMRQHEQ